MPMVAVKPPYTLILREDTMADDPREADECFGTMVCWHNRYHLGDKHDHKEPEDFLRQKLLNICASPAAGCGKPVYDFIKAGKAKNARLAYNKSGHAWELRENQHWNSNSDWFVSSGYPARLKGADVPDWFLEECIATLRMDEMLELLQSINSIVLMPLYLYDHSGITMNTTGFSCPWDSGQVGWIYADKDKILLEFGGDTLTPELREKAEALLTGEVKYYDHYLRGDCYGFQLYKGDEEIDNCWGFLGDMDELRDSIEEYVPMECKGIMNNLTYRYDNKDIEDILREQEGEFALEVG